MTSTTFRVPPALPWLSPAHRPSRDEIHTYAELIAANEGMPRESAGRYEREAELQLWVWRSETGRRPMVERCDQAQTNSGVIFAAARERASRAGTQRHRGKVIASILQCASCAGGVRQSDCASCVILFT